MPSRVTAATLTMDAADRLCRIVLGHDSRKYPRQAGSRASRAGRRLHPARPASDILQVLRTGCWPAHFVASPRWVVRRVAHPVLVTSRSRNTGWRVAFCCPTRGAWLRAAKPNWRGTRMSTSPPPSCFWSKLLRPRLRRFLPRAAYPVRNGSHSNAAFVLLLAAEYAAARDPELPALLRFKTTE